MIALLLAATLAQGATTGQAVRVEVVVRPDTVTIGDPITVLARAWTPRGAIAEFPAVVATGDAVEALDPRITATRAGGRETVGEATYRLVAWQTGTFALPLGDVVVTHDGVAARVPLETRSIVVRSLLPSDSAKRVPRPARPMVPLDRPWWDGLPPWIAAVALLTLAWLAWRRRQRRRRLAREGAPVDPLADAVAAFDRLERHGFADGGEPGRHVALAAEIVRDYLAARYDDASTSLTASEVVALLRVRRGVPGDRLGALLADADLVKFARRTCSAADAHTFADGARALVCDVHAESRPPVRERAA